MTNKKGWFSEWIDWVAVHVIAGTTYMLHVLEKHDHVLDVLTKNASRATILGGFVLIVVRLYKAINNKGANGD